MMHGYLPFDKDGNQIAAFRTWRNTNSREASAELTELFQFNIPERWSIAHLYQSILEKMDHVNKIDFFTTLAGYIHWQLTGQKVLGIGDVAGMFPVDSETMDYRRDLIEKFNQKVSQYNYPWKLEQLLPKCLCAGDDAGKLTEEGAKRLDKDGDLVAGIPLCPPEGDAGTGMVATNSVKIRTGNVSAGTSIFAMIVLEKSLKKLHREIDNVTTPDGHQVAMVHANNCTSDINAWVKLFSEFSKLSGHPVSNDQLFPMLFNEALKGENDCGGIMNYGYYSGEFITGLSEGRPMLIRTPDSNFTIGNLMRSNLYTSLGAVRLGMDILTDEGVKIDKLLGHGGLFKTEIVGQQIMADALKTPVWVMTTAGEGGAWGIAVLAAFLSNRKNGQSLPDFLDETIFCGSEGSKRDPEENGMKGFDTFIKRYVDCLPVEGLATEKLK